MVIASRMLKESLFSRLEETYLQCFEPTQGRSVVALSSRCPKVVVIRPGQGSLSSKENSIVFGF